ncbi:MAG: hypothetical protein ABIO04_03045 [Ferruginibacter sp.]
MPRILLLFIATSLFFNCFAQPVCKDVLKFNRDKLYRNIVNNTITNNLSLQLTDSTEENWQDAFWAIQMVNYRTAWIDNTIHGAFNEIQKRSLSFQRSLIEIGFAIYPGVFMQQSKALLLQANDAKLFAMTASYLLQSETTVPEKKFLQQVVSNRLSADTGNPILQQLSYQVNGPVTKVPSIHTLLQKDYLPGKVLMISFQRMNRDFPGLVMIRDTNGVFIKDHDSFFYVPQLARSITNMPGYITNGNTPEGIFRMDGFDVSKSSFIGPSRNIQLTMPFEFKASHFYDDISMVDTIWDLEQYEKLLPSNFSNYYPMFQSFLAGKAGRSEIIAHGTTVDPRYYKDRQYYPLTPTQGCLCTKEIWNEKTGTLIDSDQLKLAAMIEKAGGAYGYSIVINIDDKQEPVSLNDILPFIELAGQK